MFSKNQKIFFLEFLVMSFAVILIMRLCGHFGPANHLFFDSISLCIIVTSSIIHIITLAYHKKAPEMITLEQFRFLMKSAIAAIILIQIMNVTKNFSVEYASPFAFIIVYCIAALSLLALLFFGGYIAVLALLILIFSIARGMIAKKKMFDSRSRHLSLAGRVFRWIAGFYIRILILGIIFTGFVIDPKATGLGALCFLFFHAVVNVIVPSIIKKGKSTDRGVLRYIITVALALPVYSYFHSLPGLHGMLEALIYAVGVGGLLYLLFTPKNDWKDSFNLGIRELLAYTLPVCLLTTGTFALGMMSARETESKELRKISDTGRVYDIVYAEGLSRLYVTSRDTPNVRSIDPETGEMIGSVENYPEPRRIAVFPEYDKVIIGSVYGTEEFSLDLTQRGEKIFDSHTIDVEKMGENHAILAQEIINNIMVYDLATGKKKHVILPFGWTWIYAVSYSEKTKAFFVSDWFFSPYVHRIEQSDFNITKSFNGYMNVGMCILPESDQLLVARPLNRRVDILNVYTLKNEGAIPAEFGIREIDCDKSNNLLFTLAHFQGILSVYDVRSMKELLKIQVGQGARSLSYDADGKILYIGSRSGIYSLDLNPTIKGLEEENRTAVQD